MLQISRRADYAVRIMLSLASQPSDKRMSAGEVAIVTDVPKSFLHKIVGDLTKAGLVRTYKGSAGGLGLSRSPAQISMLDIVEAVDGPLCLNQCLLQPSECPRDGDCPAHIFWGRLQLLVMESMREATLARLLDDIQDDARRLSRDEIPYVFIEQLSMNT